MRRTVASRRSSNKTPRRSRLVVAAREEYSEEVTRSILIAAAGLFRERGYKATTLRGIAKAADMKASSLYYYFGSKEEILLTVIDKGHAGIDKAVREAVGALPPDSSSLARLRQAVRAHLRALLDPKDYATVYVRIYNQLPSSVKRWDYPRRLAYFAYWRQLIEAAQSAGEIRRDLQAAIFVDFLIGAMSRTPEWYSPKVVSIDRFSDWVIEWILHGIMPKGRSGEIPNRR